MSLDFRADLNDVKRKVTAANTLLPGANPESSTGPDSQFRMSLHRDVMRGVGFYGTLSKFLEFTDALPAMVDAWSLEDEPGKAAAPAPVKLRDLPVVNFLDIPDESLVTAVVKEALPQDMPRFKTYLSSRPLGIGLIAAPVSF